MKNEIVDIRKYRPKDAEKYLFDANIWLSICYPMGNHEKERTAIYSTFLKAAMDCKAKIVICSMVLSEVVNRWFRMEYGILHDNNPAVYANYKHDFRDRDIYKTVAKEIESGITNQILKIATPIDDGFTKVNIVGIFSNIAELDFNDLCHADLANREDLILVTNDGDFASIGANIKVLTANNKMIGLARKANVSPN